VSNSKSEKAEEYVLITGEIVFIDPKVERAFPNAIRANGVMMLSERKLNRYAMGKAQQVLQANFHQKMGEVEVQVVDVVLFNFTWLGRMTPGEFSKMPDGLKIQERAPESDEPSAAPATPSTSTAALDELASND
jgi:hypothetical protein